VGAHDVSVYDLGDGVTAPRADAHSCADTTPAATAETPDRNGAYPRLTEGQLETLSTLGERQATTSGQVLFREGERHYDFYVVLAGTVAVYTGAEPDSQLVAVHGPLRFLGELGLLTDEASFLTAIVQEPGEVLVVPVERIRELVAHDAVFSDLLLRAYMVRRSRLIGLRGGLRIIGSKYSPDTRRLCQFAARNRIPHSWIDVEDDPAAEALLQQLAIRPEDMPVVVWSDDIVLRKPSNADLARVVGLPAPPPRKTVCDVVVVGMGPAGLAATVYGASEGLDTISLDSVATGGQAATSSRIENYLGFPSGISGAELAERASLQATKFGARMIVPAQAVGLEHRDGHYLVRLEDGDSITTRTVVVATGARYRRLEVPGVERFEGTNVFYAATEIEANACRSDPVAIVGGGNSAGQAATFLMQHASRVTLVVRERDLGEHMSRYLVDRVRSAPNVDVLLHTEVAEVIGDEHLEGITVVDDETGERRDIDARALFVFIGAVPFTAWLRDVLALDSRGYVLTGADVPSSSNGSEPGPRRQPHPLEASRPGVFAVGDVRHGATMRVATAVGEGAMSIRLVHEHLADRHSLERPEGARGG
jgi:thioredoxin reductase (NADPH)